MKLFLIGASGLTGQELVQMIWKEYRGDSIFQVPARSFSPPDNFDSHSLAFLCTEEEASRKWVELLSPKGGYIIDLSSAFRLKDGVPLVIPEINGELIRPETKLYASPNCTTSILVMGLFPIWKRFGLKAVFASSYQSVSGAGKQGVAQWEREMRGQKGENSVFPRSIHRNYFPQVGSIGEDGLSLEERKVIQETQKILNQTDFTFGVICVRVPTYRGHALSVFVQTVKPIDYEILLDEIRQTPGLVHTADYATPLDVEGKDEVFLGRLRVFGEHHLSFWVISDNVRKGGATNAFQIARKLIMKVRECSEMS
ncbi:MAG: Asd/ArgC dimerization domain-containing protein [bacterium]